MRRDHHYFHLVQLDDTHEVGYNRWPRVKTTLGRQSGHRERRWRAAENLRVGATVASWGLALERWDHITSATSQDPPQRLASCRTSLSVGRGATTEGCSHTAGTASKLTSNQRDDGQLAWETIARDRVRPRRRRTSSWAGDAWHRRRALPPHNRTDCRQRPTRSMRRRHHSRVTSSAIVARTNNPPKKTAMRRRTPAISTCWLIDASDLSHAALGRHRCAASETVELVDSQLL